MEHFGPTYDSRTMTTLEVRAVLVATTSTCPSTRYVRGSACVFIGAFDVPCWLKCEIACHSMHTYLCCDLDIMKSIWHTEMLYLGVLGKIRNHSGKPECVCMFWVWECVCSKTSLWWIISKWLLLCACSCFYTFQRSLCVTFQQSISILWNVMMGIWFAQKFSLNSYRRFSSGGSWLSFYITK